MQVKDEHAKLWNVKKFIYTSVVLQELQRIYS